MAGTVIQPLAQWWTTKPDRMGVSSTGPLTFSVGEPGCGGDRSRRVALRRWAKQCSSRDAWMLAGSQFCWSGRGRNGRRRAWINIVILNDILNRDRHLEGEIQRFCRRT